MHLAGSNLLLFSLLRCIFFCEASGLNGSVVVIGAGASGIAAATRLLENGFGNVVVLEAERRIGGRVHSVKFGDSFVDLGAESCHGQGNNIVYEKVKDLHVLKSRSPLQTIYSHNGKLDDDFGTELLEIMEGIYSSDGDRDDPEGTTVGEYCTGNFNKSAHERYCRDPDKLKVAFLALQLFEREVLSSEGSFSWFHPSAKSDYRDCDGDLQLSWDGHGYKTILEVMMKKYPDPNLESPIDNKILLNKEAKKINVSNEGVRVECSDGSTYIADHVIVTTSIGMLKSADLMPLPREKKEAIEKIGFEGVMKIFMRFSERWWNDSDIHFHFLWSGEHDKLLKNDRIWLKHFYTIGAVPNNHKVLAGWITGDKIPFIEKLSDEEIEDGIAFAIDIFLGKEFNVTKPVEVIRSAWCTNPHFRGTYSFETPHTRNYTGLSPKEEISKPLENDKGVPVVLFAGEATHPHYYSTVHGAIETGYREADRLLKFYKKDV